MKKNDPDVDHGFHAVIPRAVRTGYKELVPLQKWLYTCLKDLCGETGTCYRTVQTLAEETGISTGMISESIPVLHAAGLIHGEKKKRSTGGKPVWHITIVDIWLLNGKIHPTKRSHSEQTQDVHNMNVHTVNDKSAERSHSEDKRSPRELERSHSETEEESTEAVSESSIILEAGKEGTDAFAVAQSSPALFEQSQIVFEHAAGNTSLWYHSACVSGHYGAAEGMVLTAVRIERAPQETRCEMCGSDLLHAPFSDDGIVAPDATVGRMPAIHVTAVSDSQPVYRQGEDNDTRSDARSHDTSRSGDAAGTDTRSHREDDLRDTGLLPTQGAVNGHLPAIAHPHVDSDVAVRDVGHMAPAERGDAAGDDHPGIGHRGIAAASAVHGGTVRVVPSAEMAGDGVQGPSRARPVPEVTQAQDIASQQTSPVPTDGAATVSPLSSEPRASGGPHSEPASQATSTRKAGVLVHTKETDKSQTATQPPLNLREDVPNVSLTKKQQERLLDRRADDLLALYCALMGDKVTRSKENMEAMRELAQADRTDEEVTLVMRNILDDPDQFLARQLTPRKLATNFTARLRTARGTPVQAPAPTQSPSPLPGRVNFTRKRREEEARKAATGGTSA